MTLGVTEYLRRLAELVSSAVATDGDGRPLSVDEAAARVVDRIRDAARAGLKIMLVGNGGSAAVVSHLQNDLCKGAGIRALVFTEPPLLTAYSNDDGYETAYESATRLWTVPGDLLIAMSSSGRSENILRACRAASEAGGTVVTFSGFLPDNPLRSLGAVNFYVRSRSYGHVETAHGALGHYVLDSLADLLHTTEGL